jgi:predicted PurR-regulated permease PerM
MGVAVAAVMLVSAVIGRSITQFQDELPVYQQRLDRLVGGAVDWLVERGVDLDRREFASSMDTGAIMALVGDTASALLAALSNITLVLLIMVFMLMEARGVPDKLRRALGDPDADLSQFARAAERVYDYLAIKAQVSLLTGLIVTAMCWAVGLDFPLLWGLIAFLFNFIPNIGSIIAAIPAILLALLQLSPERAVLLGLGYLAVNMVIGNFLEPRMMGRRLGLSTLVVLLSMLFWNWVWGPVGMLLSVPLTVIVKISLEHTSDLRWLAVLLGPNDDASDGPGESRFDRIDGEGPVE